MRGVPVGSRYRARSCDHRHARRHRAGSRRGSQTGRRARHDRGVGLHGRRSPGPGTRHARGRAWIAHAHPGAGFAGRSGHGDRPERQPHRRAASGRIAGADRSVGRDHERGPGLGQRRAGRLFQGGVAGRGIRRRSGRSAGPPCLRCAHARHFGVCGNGGRSAALLLRRARGGQGEARRHPQIGPPQAGSGQGLDPCRPAGAGGCGL